MRRPFLERVTRALQELGGSNPEPVRKRQAFRGATYNRLYEDWVTTNRQIDEEVRGDIRLLRSRGRDLARNDSYARQFLRLKINNILGHKGFDLQPQVMNSRGMPDEEANRGIRDAWIRWSTSRVSVDGQLSWHALVKLCIRTLEAEGEAFLHVVRGWPFNDWRLALEPIDADLVDETFNRSGDALRNEIRMGVEIDPVGRRVGYWVLRRPRHLYGYTAVDRYFIPAEDMIHLMDPLRFNQTRGVSRLNSEMLTSHRRDGTEEAELVATHVGASKMGILETQEGSQLGELDDDQPMDIEANPGTFVQLAKGWKMTPWNPEHPNTGLKDFLKYLLRRIASGWGVGYNAMANDYEGVTWTSLRQNNLVDRDEWRQEQRFWIEALYEPFYPIWMNAALLSGQLPLGSFDARRFLRANWQPRGWESVQPVDDVDAAEREVALGINTRTRLAAERGRDFEENLRQLAREKELAAAAGVDVDGVKRPAVSQQVDPGTEAGTNGSTNGNGTKGAARGALLQGGDRFR